MDIDPQKAKSLGFPKPEYTSIELERRWLCRAMPSVDIVQTEAITDLYVEGTRLRLREARPVNGGPPMLRFSRKADIDAQTRLITSIYLSEDEFALLASLLPGSRITKLRHRLRPSDGVRISIDEFQGELSGLILVEAEFDTPDQLVAFSKPSFAVLEVTSDRQFTGAYLAQNGRPAPE